jgi:hypothetical protein
MLKQVRFGFVEEMGQPVIDTILINGLFVVGGPAWDEWVFKSPLRWPDVIGCLRISQDESSRARLFTTEEFRIHNGLRCRYGSGVLVETGFETATRRWAEDERLAPRYVEVPKGVFEAGKPVCSEWLRFAIAISCGRALVSLLYENAFNDKDPSDCPDIFEFEKELNMAERRTRRKEIWTFLKGRSWLLLSPSVVTNEPTVAAEQISLWVLHPSAVIVPAALSPSEWHRGPFFLNYRRRAPPSLPSWPSVTSVLDRDVWIPVVASKGGDGYRILYDTWTINGMYVRDLERGVVASSKNVFRALGFPMDERAIRKAREDYRRLWQQMGQTTW